MQIFSQSLQSPNSIPLIAGLDFLILTKRFKCAHVTCHCQYFSGKITSYKVFV